MLRVKNILAAVSSDTRRLIVCQLAVACAYTAMCALFDNNIGNIARFYVPPALYGGEGLLLGGLLWVLGGRWRRVVPVLLCLMAIYLWANTMYFRYWGDLISWSLIIEPASYNSFVFTALPSLLRPSDALFALVPAAFMAVYRKCRVSAASRPGIKVVALAVALSIAAYACGLMVATFASYRYHKKTGAEVTYAAMLADKFGGGMNCLAYDWHSNGMIVYTYRQLTRHSNRIDVLTPEQRERIDNYLVAKSNYEHTDSTLTATFAANRGKNLILIVVESLNSWVLGQQAAGRSITPTIDSLKQLPGTLWSDSIVSERRLGGSSDSHLMYSTGLLPVAEGSAAMLYAANDYSCISLAHHFPVSVDIIGENGAIWNHRATTRGYGFDRLVEGLLAGTTEAIDRTIFVAAADTIALLPRPFFAEIITLGMHFPFVDEHLSLPTDLVASLPSDPIVARYYRTVYGFDCALGDFLNRLRAMGLYDDSIIVIASDHELDVSTHRADGRIPIIILNSGLGGGIGRIEGLHGQGDVFPTILEVMGIEAPCTGVGTSMLHPAMPDSLRQEAFIVSDLIIRSGGARLK